MGRTVDAMTGADVPAGVEITESVASAMAMDLRADAAVDAVIRCREALRALPPGDSLAGVQLRAAQVVAAAQISKADAALAASAQTIAARLGDELARGYALAAWAAAHPEPEHAQGRADAAAQILEVASGHDDTVLATTGYALLLVALLERGDIRSLDTRLLEQRTAGATPSPHTTPAQWYHCLRSMLDGDTVAAEQQAEEQYAQARDSNADALGLYVTRIGMIRWMQGRIDGVEEGFLAARREYPRQLLWPASLAWLWMLQGRRTSAETLLRTLPPVADLPHDRYWLSTVTVLAEIARHHGTRENAERLRLLLLPFADHLVPVGVGVSFWGTCARTLGLLEERLDLLDDARAHLELAIEMSGRIGALAWHAEAQIELAEFALRHELPDVPAYELLAEARATAEARGFTALAQRARYRPRVRVLGRFEVISLTGDRAEWTSRKARELLKMLVAARGVATSREVFMDALWPGDPPAALGNRFAVAINVIRRALDPDRVLPMQHHVVTEGESVRLELENLDIDLERFLTLAERDDASSRQAAVRLYLGDAFSDEPYADWAIELRDQARDLRRALD